MRAFFWTAAALLALGTCARAQAVDLKDGDIVFHTSRSAQSLAIQRATGSKYSHMGLVLFRNGKPLVLEAIATVRYTPLAEWTRDRRSREAGLVPPG